MSKATIVCVWLFAACASGSNGTGGGSDQPVDAAVRQDSSTISPADAAVTHDAPASMPDAQTSQTPDAGGGSGGLFCNSNTDCTVSGECCVNLGGPGFCAAGTPVGNSICFPD